MFYLSEILLVVCVMSFIQHLMFKDTCVKITEGHTVNRRYLLAALFIDGLVLGMHFIKLVCFLHSLDTCDQIQPYQKQNHFSSIFFSYNISDYSLTTHHW